MRCGIGVAVVMLLAGCAAGSQVAVSALSMGANLLAADAIGRSGIFGPGETDGMVKLTPEAREAVMVAASVDRAKFGCYEDIAVGSFPKDDPRVERLNLLWTDADLTEVRAERGLRAAIDEARTDASYRWGWCSHFL
jgi:hypothetical protein